MEWYQNWKSYVGIAYAASIIALAIILLQGPNTSTVVLSCINLLLIYPFIFVGLYMWGTGNGKRWVNGFDWSKYSEEQSKRIVSDTGLYIAVSMYALALFITLLSYNMTVALVGLAAAIIILIVGFIYLLKRKSIPVFTEKSKNKMIAGIIVLLLLLVPCAYLSATANSVNGVEISMGETSMTVRANYFDHTFEYKDIDSVEIIDNFDRGHRVYGEALNDQCSGKWNNSRYGDYELAMYTNVDKVVSIHYKGGWYVFNLQTEDKTVDLYNKIVEKTE